MILDACQSGALTRVKGGRVQQAFAVPDERELGAGDVFLTASAKLFIEIGLGGGASLWTQRFETTNIAPARSSLAPYVSCTARGSPLLTRAPARSRLPSNEMDAAAWRGANRSTLVWAIVLGLGLVGLGWLTG